MKDTKRRIPLWVNIMQMVLILIMAMQVFEHFFDLDAMAAAGFAVETDAQLNLNYEMGSRLGAMIVVSIFVMITQNPLQYLVVLIMNVFRESTEMIIDPLYPVANADFSPTTDVLIHVVIVAIELAALITVAKIVKQDSEPAALQPA